MDAIAVAQSIGDSQRDESTGKVELEIISVLKGNELIKPGDRVSVVYYGAVEPGRRFMLSGADPENIQWACLPITDVSEKYLLDISKLPDDPLERLKFFQPYLQHPDTMLNRDAYDEFAITPYPVIKDLKPFMNHDELMSWIKEPEMPADRKRLYLTMLGVCGTEDDVPVVEDMLRSTLDSTRGGLDALIACYLVLAGEKGLATVDELFLTNKQAPYADTYAAIMAIRFHGTETDRIPRSALVQSLHHVLERKDLADLVIPDLARWGDWSQIDRLVKLFIDAEKDNNWIRVPVVNYLRMCPKPEAAAAIEKLKAIDPDSVKRASSFFSIPVPAPTTSPSTSQRKRKPDHLFAKAVDEFGGLDPKLLAIGHMDSDTKLAAKPLFPRTEHAFAIAHGTRRDIRPLAAIHSGVTTNRWLAWSVLPLAFLTGLIALYAIIVGGDRPQLVPVSLNIRR